MTKHVSDAINHVDSDSGCAVTSEYLGKPSYCLECPFPKECALKLGITVRTIRRFRRSLQAKRLRKREKLWVAEMAEKLGIADG